MQQKSGRVLALGDAGNDAMDVGVSVDRNAVNLAHSPAVNRAALFPSSRAAFRRMLSEMRLRRKTVGSKRVLGNPETDGVVSSLASPHLLLSSKDDADAASSKEEQEQKEKQAKPLLSPSPPFAVPSPMQVRLLRDHVSKFTKRSDAMGALVTCETAFWWVLTAAAPTLFDRSRCGSSSSFSLVIFFNLAWGVLRSLAYVRTVILMHDLVHGVVFKNRKLNSFLADVFGLLAWTSARDFGHNHGRHHARLGVEEELDFDADHTVFWTKREWEEWRPGPSKVVARFFRDPFVYHVFSAPAYLLFFGSTHPGFGPGIPFGLTVRRLFKEQWLRVVGVVAGFASIAIFVGVGRFWQELAAGWFSLICGAAIFALQHDAIAPPLRGYRSASEQHSRDAAALLGSTFIPVPEFLSSRATLGIEFHHIHHLDARVPCYELWKCHHSVSPPGAWEEAGVPVLRGWRDVLRGLSMSLYDEATGEFAPFPPLLKPGEARETMKRVIDEARKGFVRLRERA